MVANDPVLSSILNGIRLIWRFLRLPAVGMAWGAPFVALVNIDKKLASYPSLTAAVTPIQLELIFSVMPLSIVIGVTVVA